MPLLKRASVMRERGMSYRAICMAMEFYEGDAPNERTLRRYLHAAGEPKQYRGHTYRENFRNAA